MKKKKITIYTFSIFIIFVFHNIYFFFHANSSILNINKKINIKYMINNRINIIMENMTIEEKIAQMLIISYNSSYIDNKLSDILKKYSPGGFIISDNNITTLKDTQNFILNLKKNSKIIPIISMDQEGGNVQRLKLIKDKSPTNIPYMYEIGKTKNEKLAFDIGKIIGNELKSIGVNVDFAPVSDIYLDKNNTVIGKRSFGDNANLVSNMSINLANGIEKEGVIPTFKHFPGHGATNIDSHFNLPIINKTYDELKENELIPFKNAINNNAKIIMIGHIALPKITNDFTPATMSKIIITKILKNDLNYTGLIITDAVNMGALQNNYSNEEIYTKSINAGIDLILMPDDIEEAINLIKKNISEKRINYSVKKILSFKYKYLNNNEILSIESFGSFEHEKIINKIK